MGRFSTDFDAAWDLCEQAYQAAETSGSKFVLGASWALKGIILDLRDGQVEAARVAEEALPVRLWRHRGVASTVLVTPAGTR